MLRGRTQLDTKNSAPTTMNEKKERQTEEQEQFIVLGSEEGQFKDDNDHSTVIKTKTVSLAVS